MFHLLITAQWVNLLTETCLSLTKRKSRNPIQLWTCAYLYLSHIILSYFALKQKLPLKKHQKIKQWTIKEQAPNLKNLG